MDRSSNDRICILFTESHEILPNVMYEIRMNGGIKRQLYLKLEFATSRTDTNGKELLNYTYTLWSFV